MCGIIGFVGRRPALPLLVAGLERLEYRGYDSAGIALQERERLVSVRSVGNLAALRTEIARSGHEDSPATTGIGHTRWATHGGVTRNNAHPHFSADGRIAVVMNGIIENYRELRLELEASGVRFTSETDTEVIPHLLAAAYAGDLASAMRQAIARLEGHYAIAAISTLEPERIVAVRRECPLVVGVGEQEQFVSSAIPAFLSETSRAVFPDDGQLIVLESHGVSLHDPAGGPVEPEVQEITWDAEAAEKGGYPSFMLKEIHEQPAALRETLAERLRADGSVELEGLGLSAAALSRIERVQIVACGTSLHAGMVGRYFLEDWARIPTQCEVASEFRYRTCLAGPGDLVIGITQSGETADTLAAMRVARERGAHVLALTNVQGSQATRDADGVLMTRAGLEIGVAATKTHTTQVLMLALLALHLGRLRWDLSPAGAAEIAEELRGIPDQLERYLASDSPAHIAETASRFTEAGFFLYLGRHVGVPLALEGALKLKEVSYVPTEAYPAGEMKHGPIALLGAGTPVVVTATDGHVFDKVISNTQEVRARGARVIAIATEGNREITAHADEVLFVPHTSPLLAPLVAILPLQLLAYELATQRGLNVDQPRNLAKTVTVE